MAAPILTAVATTPRSDDRIVLAEVEETEAGYLFDLLPELPKENVDVLLCGRCLTVTGRTVEGMAGAAAVPRAFHYELHLPDEIDPGTVCGSFRDGVLRVWGDKLRRSRPRRLPLV